MKAKSKLITPYIVSVLANFWKNYCVGTHMQLISKLKSRLYPLTKSYMPNIYFTNHSHSIGTVRVSWKGLPKAVVAKTVKLKKGESVFRRKGNILCLKWFDKRPVSLISTIHQAVELQVKTNFVVQPIIKPHLIHDYNLKMGGVDHSDNFLSHYQTLKSIKWYRKLILHLINMATLNAYICHSNFRYLCRTHLFLYRTR